MNNVSWIMKKFENYKKASIGKDKQVVLQLNNKRINNLIKNKNLIKKVKVKVNKHLTKEDVQMKEKHMREFQHHLSYYYYYY